MKFQKASKRAYYIIAALLLIAACDGAQAPQPRDPRSFPFKEAVDPAVVVHPEPTTLRVGTHPRGTNDPLFMAQELLGRPTDTTITVNAAAIKDVEVFYEYGTKPGIYTGKTTPALYPGNEPFNILIDKLHPDTLYYYRMRYREPGAENFTARSEHTFHTQRRPGSTFTFDIEFDPHMAENSDDEAYKLTLKKIVADKPDFLIDLGDNFFSDRLNPITQAGVVSRVQLLRTYYDIVDHSAPLFLAIGNHEGEWAKNQDGTPNNVAVWGTLARKKYFPNPVPNNFYTGSTTNEPFVGLREANYAWQWGDALFIVLDPYWHKPVAPELSGDWWTTLGREQYEWLKRTLETSNATYKFIFSHNLIGGLDMKGLMRGGIETVKYLEMGGHNLDGTWGFDKARPGWAMPIHQLLVANNATIYFHGHDHLYAKQDLDGIVYQEGPQPSREDFDLASSIKTYNYLHGTVLGGGGYLRVRVSLTNVKVEYVQTWKPEKETDNRKDGMVADSYTIEARRQNPNSQ